MSKIFLLLLSFCIGTRAFGQAGIYKPFKLDLAIGLSFKTGNTYFDNTFTFSAEPKYNLSDQFSLGLRLEVSPNIDFAGTSDPFTINSVSSYLLTGDYFFNKSKITRPFFGIGAGIFNQTLTNEDLPDVKTKSQKPGLETRVGFERKHLRLALEYNVTFFKEEKKMNYVTFKVGTFLGGNRINK
jgi:hypothetical protein